MSDKLQELTDRLYQEGVERGKAEAAEILKDAEERREFLLKKAEEDARDILEKGKRDLESLKARTEAELAMAGRQAESTLRQKLTNVMADSLLTHAVGEALNDESLLGGLMTSLMESWSSEGKVPELSLLMGERDRKRFESGLRERLKGNLGDSTEISFSGKISGGFRVEARDGSYAVSFTDRDFEEFFRSFIRERTRASLFGES